MRRIWRKTIPLLALALLTSLLLTSAYATGYRDVPGHWAERQIMRWSDLGYLTGYGDATFGPDDAISRAQLAVIMTNLLGYTEQAENTFGLPEDAWYLSFVLRAVEAGMFPDNWQETPCDAGLAREEAMYIIAAAAGLKLSDVSPTEYYTDGDTVSDWAAGAVSAMTEAGYVGGFPDGGVHPKDVFTRAEVVTILNNMYPAVYNRAGTYSEDVAGLTVINTGDVRLKDMVIDGDLFLTRGLEGQSVILDHVTVTGEIVNRGGADVLVYDDAYPVGGFVYGSSTVSIPAGSTANLFDPARYYYNEDGWYSYRSDYYDASVGIDVSSHQGKIDWQAVADSGVEFAMIRVGFRGYTVGSVNLDTRFLYNIQGALDAGLDVGVYFFSQAITPEEAEEEARFVLENIQGYDITYPVVFDWETISGDHARTDGMTSEMLNRCAQAFTGVIAEAGYTPSIYTYTWLGYNLYDQTLLADYHTWVADYKAVPEYYFGFDMLQYSSTGTVPGIEGDVDLDIAFRLME